MIARMFGGIATNKGGFLILILLYSICPSSKCDESTKGALNQADNTQPKVPEIKHTPSEESQLPEDTPKSKKVDAQELPRVIPLPAPPTEEPRKLEDNTQTNEETDTKTKEGTETPPSGENLKQEKGPSETGSTGLATEQVTSTTEEQMLVPCLPSEAPSGPPTGADTVTTPPLPPVEAPTTPEEPAAADDTPSSVTTGQQPQGDNLQREPKAAEPAVPEVPIEASSTEDAVPSSAADSVGAPLVLPDPGVVQAIQEEEEEVGGGRKMEERVLKGSGDMPSFDEWKQKMLAEQEKTKQSANTHVSVSTPSKPKPKNSLNYASVSCGAKILGANPEATNPSFVLSENKDQYMINPCKAKKWFTVELCEPVQVHSLEIANLELFSSTPETFRVHISDRFPTKDWKLLGKFHAREERSAQSFQTVNEEIYAKYLKVEMLTHYGHEHYCPVTTLRVYGSSMAEDYDESDPHADEDGSDSDSMAGHKQDGEEPKNLFTSATDTVISLVRKVLRSEDGEEATNATALNTTERPLPCPGNNRKLNDSSENATLNVTEDGQPLPCVPEASPNATPHSPGEAGLPVMKPETPTAHVLPSKPIEEENKEEEEEKNENSIVTKIEDDDPAMGSETKPMVTLIETPSLKRDALLLQLAKCNYCEKDAVKVRTCILNRFSLCAFLQCTLNICVDADWCITRVRGSLEIQNVTLGKLSGIVGRRTLRNAVPTDTQGRGVEATTTSVSESIAQTSIVTILPSQISSSAASSIPAQSSMTESSSISQSQTTRDVASDSHTSIQLEATPSVVTRTAKLQSSEHKQNVAPSSVTSAESVSSSVSALDSEVPVAMTTPAMEEEAASTMGPDVIQVRPSDAETVSSDTASVAPPLASQETTVISEAAVSSSTVTPTLSSSVEASEKVESSAVPVNNGKEFYAESKTPSKEEDIVIEHIPAEEPVRSGTGKRETAVMRLNNRMKGIELNLSLSSRYLEELSQRYRTQMEELNMAFNKTLKLLTNTSTSAISRDMEQQKYIDTLQGDVRNLSLTVQSLKQDIQHIYQDMSERHLYFLMIEIFVMALILLLCLMVRTRQVVVTRAPTAEETPEYVAPSRDKNKKCVARRRNSSDATIGHNIANVKIPNRLSVETIGASTTGTGSSSSCSTPGSSVRSSPRSNSGSSEVSAVAIVQPSQPLLEDWSHKDLEPPKKKKKRRSQGKTLVHSKSAAGIAAPTKMKTSISATKLTSAGLIFSGGGQERTKDAKNTLSKSSSTGNLLKDIQEEVRNQVDPGLPKKSRSQHSSQEKLPSHPRDRPKVASQAKQGVHKENGVKTSKSKQKNNNNFQHNGKGMVNGVMVNGQNGGMARINSKKNQQKSERPESHLGGTVVNGTTSEGRKDVNGWRLAGFFGNR